MELAYTYTQRTTGPRKRKTTTTWYLDHLTLTAVQTKGVAFKPAEESSADDEDDGK